MQVFASKRGLTREHVSGTFSTGGFFHTRGQPRAHTIGIRAVWLLSSPLPLPASPLRPSV